MAFHKDLSTYFKFQHIGFIISLCSLGAVVASKFPGILTTDTLRIFYKAPTLNFVFWAAIGFSFIAAIYGLLVAENKKTTYINLASIMLAFLIYLLPAFDYEIGQGTITIGLDWLIIDLLLTGLIFTPFELFAPLHPSQSKFHANWKTDLTYFIVFDLSIKFILLAIRFPALYFFTNPAYAQFQSKIQAIPFPLQLLMALIIADFFQYARHYTAHKIPFLWKFHSIHHSPENMDWLAGSRSHLCDLIFDRSVIFMPIYFLGFSTPVFLSYTFVVAFQSVWAHTNSHINLGFLKYVIVTPQFHHWHHAKEKDAHDKNFAVHFPFIDMLFGTYQSLENGHPQSTGVPDPKFPKQGYLKQFLYPFKR